MAFKCGHCGEKHDTVAEARKCAEARSQVKSQSKSQVNDEPETMRPKSQEFLRDLLNQFGLMLPNNQTVETIDWQIGKEYLHALIAARRLRATHQPYSTPSALLHNPNASPKVGSRPPTPRRLPDCPPGYYAVPDWTGHEQFKFFWVKIKRGNGPYAGWTFVDEVIGGHVDHPCRGKYAHEAIEHILEFGPELAGALYADQLKHCKKCNKHLTKKASRILHMGRYCATNAGLGDDWDALNWKFNDADAEDDD
jgi:hypothetical protein